MIVLMDDIGCVCGARVCRIEWMWKWSDFDVRQARGRQVMAHRSEPEKETEEKLTY